MDIANFLQFKRVSIVLVPALILSGCQRTLPNQAPGSTQPPPVSPPPANISDSQVPPTNGAEGVPTFDFATIESDILTETNRARSNPSAYAALLKKQRPYYRDKRFERPGQIPILTQEGLSAVDEAIDFLEQTRPLSSLGASVGMAKGARDHVLDQGPKGETGHLGSDGSEPWDRIGRYGKALGLQGENISYGPATGQDVVISLIVDDGVPDRGHRETIFNPEFKIAGVACGPHLHYRIMCAITYASGYSESVSWSNRSGGLK